MRFRLSPPVLSFVLLLSLAVACGRDRAADKAPSPHSAVDRRVTDAELSRLPVATVTEGKLVCTAIGADFCPLRSAFANWLSDTSLALWEPGRPIAIIDKATPQGRPFGKFGEGAGRYSIALAVGPFEGGGIAIIDGARARMIRFNSTTGENMGEYDVPRPEPGTAPGFVGSTPVLQSLRPKNDSGGIAFFNVQVLRTQKDKKGITLLDIPVNWIKVNASGESQPVPLFGALPAYALDGDETFVWTPSDSFWVQRRSYNKEVLWTLSSDRKGFPMDSTDIAMRRNELLKEAPKGSLTKAELDSMQARTGAFHPAIGGLVIEPKGRVLVVPPATPSRDSIEYVLLSNDGTPTHRFNVSARVHPLLFRGDSLLVHRPTEGEPWEVRWLHIALPAAKSASSR